MSHVLSVRSRAVRRVVAFAPAGLLFAGALSPAAAAQATFSSGVLTLIGGSADDDITIHVGPQPGRVEVSGIQGGGTVTGVRAIVASLGAGQDKLQVLGSATFLPRLDLDFGSGLADAKIDFVFRPVVVPVVSAGIRIRTSDQQDVVNVTLKTAPGQTNVLLDLSLGNGTNDVSVLVEPENAAAAVRARVTVNGGTGIDKVLLDVGGDTPEAVAELFGNLGAGEDEANVVLETSSGGANRYFGDLILGTGNDKFLLNGSNGGVDIAGRVLAGDGLDTLEVVSNRGFSGGLLLDAGEGNDSVKLISALPNASASRILAGGGDDNVEVLRGSGTAQTPTTSDGGPGFDVFTGIGRATNFEVVNP